jgi:TolB-like protein/DNA-binding winged helix-turn-helix (wHTH) protein/Flp pilus assembly protein TadD
VATEPVRLYDAVKFGEDFELSLKAYELRRTGQALKLEPTPFGILALLVERRGELVSRQDIVERIWGTGVFLDTDNSINGAVRKIRQVLNDDPENPRFIQTVTGKGYRFIAPIVGSDEEHPRIVDSIPFREAKAEKGAWRNKAGGFLLLAVLLPIALGVALWLIPGFSHRAVASPPIRSIAVLPLVNLSGDPTQDYFADAMTDELITDLAKVGALRVTSRTTVTLYKHTSKKLPEIARELNVDGIVEGSVVRSGQRVRVTAQLIRGSADQHLWAESYDRDFGDALQLQSDVARAITEQVRAKLTPELKAQFSTSRSVDPEAYDSYLRGRYHIYNESFTDPKSLNQAKDAFEDAIRRDPNFSPAYSGLAETYVCMAIFGQGQISAAEAFSLARKATAKALELDPSNGEAYDALGSLNWHADFDWKAAEQSFSKAIALSPSFSCAHEDRAIFLALMGRRAEALAELQSSKQLDPGPISDGVESAVYFQLREWERLLESSRRQLASNANDWTVHASLGVGYESMRKFPEAIAEYQKAIELSNGGDLNAVASLGHAYAVAGHRYEAEKILRDLEQKSREGKASPYLSATIYAGLGETDKSLALIEKAYGEKSLDVAWILKPDLRTDNLRSDPRFQELLHRVGLN